MELKGKKVAVAGFGVNNRSVSVWLKNNGAKVTICDEDKKVKPIIVSTLGAGVKMRLGKGALDRLADFDIVIRSPGISLSDQRIRDVLAEGKVVTSGTKLFFANCPSQIIGVTGTKGKGTTSTLIWQMLRKGGKSAFLAGNIGKDPFDFVDVLKKDDVVVLELSSFQLEDLDTSPHIAVLLPISSDHLDHHGSEKKYHLAKKQIIAYQTKNDFAVLARDNQFSRIFSGITKGSVFWYSTAEPVVKGVYIKDDAIYYKNAEHEVEKVATVPELFIRAKHLLTDLVAAVQTAKIVGVSNTDINQAIVDFKGLPHRLEKVSEKDGVEYFDDSYATGPDSAIAGVMAFASRQTIAIVGGSDKGADYTSFGSILARRAKAVIAIGITGPKIIEAVKKFQFNHQPIIFQAKDLEEAVSQANKTAESGDVVLLAPASASFDMFKNATERGERFQTIVKSL